MAEQSRDYYQITGAQTVQDIVQQLNFVLNRLSDRLDGLEGLRGKPTFHKSTMLFPTETISAGQVLKGTSSTEATVGGISASEVGNAVSSLESGISANINIEKSLTSLIDYENDTIIHQIPSQWLDVNSEVHGFYLHEPPALMPDIHARVHDLANAQDHTSSATSGQLLIADANGLPTDGSNTDTEISDTVSAVSAGLAGSKIYYVSDSSGGAVDRKLTFTGGILTAET